MKRYEIGFEPLPKSPLIGLSIEQCEIQIEGKEWNPAIKIQIGFLFFKINFVYINFNS